MQIGAKIYFEKNTGNKIVVVGDIQGYVVKTTTEQDFENYEELKKYDKNAVGKIQLEFGELDRLLDKNKANSFKIDVTGTEPKLIFEWIDYNTGEPGEKPKTTEEELEETKKKVENLEQVIHEIMLSKIQESMPDLPVLPDMEIPAEIPGATAEVN